MNKIYVNSILVALAGTSFLACSAPSFASKYQDETTPTGITIHKDGVHEVILIKATPAVVWQSMQDQRKIDPDSQYCKPAIDNTKPVVEQKFVWPSPFGDAECVLHLSETFAQRVDFRLIESEDLRKMEGCWKLTPEDNGQSTKLELSSYVLPHMLIPQFLTNTVISHKAKRNLAQVKKLAEKAPEKTM